MGSYLDSHYFLHYHQGILNSSEMKNNIENFAGRSSTFCHTDGKTIAANKSHSEAERRRRKRINGHLATLRTLVPKTIKADKASLLAEVVQYLRDLQENASKAAASTPYLDEFSHHLSGGGMNIPTLFPSEKDELELCYCNKDEAIVQVTLCYEDRSDIMAELSRAIKSIQGKIVRAEMSTIDGRTKNIFWVQLSIGGDEGLVRLRRALKIVLNKTDFLPGHKRPRVYLS
ncbi:hypothetical protein Leryth_012784 [Lithospermum erythrorhizon]|nr:hypothetical protein Leryth_012784 [Lithospermum erythrorhizon]